MRIPEGYVLVPVEPTEKMVRHGDMNYSWSVAKIYKAMAASAPPVELPAYDEAKERELFEEWASSVNLSLDKMHTNLPFLFKDPNVNCLWAGWKACAKSRAGIQS